MIDAAQVRQRVDEQRRRIAAAGGVDVRLVAVTKTHGAEAIRAAVAAGCRAIGENYVQELVAKVAELDPAERPEIRFIGRLQTNKVRQPSAWST
ncbi:MAG: alanine racemase [Ilumatobacteraceae bacterium]